VKVNANTDSVTVAAIAAWSLERQELYSTVDHPHCTADYIAQRWQVTLL